MTSNLPLTQNINATRDPVNLEAYEANMGYQAVRKALNEMSPADCLKVVQDSGLRGRGGAGFPTGMKWSYSISVDDSSRCGVYFYTARISSRDKTFARSD